MVRRFPLCQPAALADVWRASGLDGVEVFAFDVPTPFRDFDDHGTLFLSGQSPAPGYVASLAEPVREQLRAILPSASSGAAELTARAWGVRGVRA